MKQNIKKSALWLYDAFKYILIMGAVTYMGAWGGITGELELSADQAQKYAVLLLFTWGVFNIVEAIFGTIKNRIKDSRNQQQEAAQ